MKLLSPEIVSDDFIERLGADLADASILRFAVAFITNNGLAAVGENLLVRVLADPRSFGVSTLSCIGRYRPLMDLGTRLGPSAAGRLKYFLDPKVRSPKGELPIELLHSKIVYLADESKSRSIVYVGSHNWTGTALGPGTESPRNAEVSLRYEEEFSPVHLAGQGNSVAAEANRHLLEAFELPMCLPVTSPNEPTFREWVAVACDVDSGGGNDALEETCVILAVAAADGAKAADDGAWRNYLKPEGTGLYLQILVERDNDPLWDNADRVMVMVWDSSKDLQQAAKPSLLLCRGTTRKAGPASGRRGTNAADNPIEGFTAVLADPHQLMDARQGNPIRPPLLASLPNGSRVEYFRLDVAPPVPTAATVDKGVIPLYQHYLQIDQIAFPESELSDEKVREMGGPALQNRIGRWTMDSLVFAETKRVRPMRPPGYRVKPSAEAEILSCLEERFGVRRGEIRALPWSGPIDPRAGRRVSAHALHDTFITGSSREESISRIQQHEIDRLVADVRPTDGRLKDIPRVQLAFTRSAESLWKAWWI